MTDTRSRIEELEAALGGAIALLESMPRPTAGLVSNSVQATFDERLAAARAVLECKPMSELAWLAEHKDHELSFGGLDEDPVWHVHSVTGGYNDRIWTLIATGDTPEAALRKAMVAPC
jgi:hypothetical protein